MSLKCRPITHGIFIHPESNKNLYLAFSPELTYCKKYLCATAYDNYNNQFALFWKIGAQWEDFSLEIPKDSFYAYDIFTQEIENQKEI